MTQIKIKRVYDSAEPSDGLRLLVDRLWPRGIRREGAPWDRWTKELAPDTELRQWFHAAPEARWEEFCWRYRTELETSEQVLHTLPSLRNEGTITLLYAAKSPDRNHALVLQQYLQEVLG